MAEVRLLPIEREDLKMIRDWRNSPEVLPYCRQYRPLSMKDMEMWFDEQTDNEYHLTSNFFKISDRDEFPIGVGGLTRIDWRNRKAEVSLYVIPTKHYKKILSLALMAIMEYAFETLNIRKIYFPVYSFNPNIEIYAEKMSREYVAKEEYYWQGQYHDRIIFVRYQYEYFQDINKV